MRRQLLAALALIVISAACKKEDDNAPPSNGGGGGPDTTGTGGSGLITGWSPISPYRDQEVTFIGGPFNTNPAQNSITAWGEPFDIISVSSTQIVAVPGPNMQTAVPGYNSVIITSGSAVDTIPYVYWRRPFDLLHFEDNLDDWVFGAPPRPGDSVVFNCISATFAGMSVSINGQNIPGPFAVDSAYYCTLGFRIPVTMGTGTDESEITTALLSATNADGRTDTLTIGWAPTPDMEIFDLQLLGGGSTFDLSDMNGGAQVLNFMVVGKYLHPNSPWVLSGPSPAGGTYGSASYPNEAFIVVNPISMQPGNYTLALTGMMESYSFSLVP
jgi:hypothetical protein